MKNASDQELRFHQDLLSLSRNSAVDSGNLEESFKAITSTVSHALNVGRASIWLYNEEQTSIICSSLFIKSTNEFSSGIELKAQDFPAYFNYLSEERTLPATDAHTNPATSEFSEVYLKPLNIFSMLDAPIRVNGKMVGVVCCEQLVSKRVWSPGEQTFIGNITDIIARALLAREKAEALKKLENLNTKLESLVQEKILLLEEQRARSMFASKMAILGEMAGSIAHEINTPLAIINSTIGYYKQISKKGPVAAEVTQEVFSEIEQTSKRIASIVKGLRFFARDSSLDQFTDASVSQIVDDTLALCREKFKAAGCDISAVVPDDLKLKCQAVSISQALLNLISNAFDAIAEREERWIKIEVTDKEKNILIKVIDSGHGIDPEIREKIMIPFFTSKPIGKGTGLGLPIVKGIIEHHHGELMIDGESPHTTFVVSLPKI